LSEPSTRRVFARAPDHLDEVILAIPALRRLSERRAEPGVDIWCGIRWTPVLEMAGLPAAIIPFRRRRAVWKTADWLRGPGYSEAYLFNDTMAAAAAAWLAAIPIRGRASSFGKGSGEHRSVDYMRVADPGWKGGALPAGRIDVPERARDQFRQLVNDRFDRPVVGIVPGSRAPARRWPEGRYTALAGILASEVGTVVAFGGPGDEVLAARVAAGAGPRGIDLGGRTSLAVFAAGLSACDVVVVNDNGALQLAGAVDARVVGVFGSRSPEEVGPLEASTRALWHSTLPCASCGKASCRRVGAGSILPEARNECLHLVSVEAVARSVREQLGEERTSSDV
jgi:ADP-heptose:LPS heptosyltransferase